MKRRFRDGLDDRRGVALLLVIVIIVMLVIVAVPFAMSMRMEFKSSATFVYEVQARFAARGALEHAIHELYKTHESLEATGQLPAPFNTPEFDGRVELTVSMQGLLDPKSKTLWAARVEDEQGKVNLNSASPYLIGNLLASAVAAESSDAGETDITVDPESAGDFAPTDGMLWVNGELIQYRVFDGSTFIGCTRGVNAATPEFFDARKIREGQLIIDARAYLLAKLPYEVQPGKFYYYRTLEEMRTIAEQKMSEDATGRSSFLYGSLTPQEFERLKPLCTVHSWRPSGEGWIRTQTILNSFPDEGSPEDRPDRILVSLPHFYPPGSIVRITQGQAVDYAMVIGNQLNTATNKGYIWINKKLTQTYDAQVAKVAMYEPHAININTAHPNVIYALFKGVGLGIKGLGYRGVMISPAEANAITAAIMTTLSENGIYRNEQDLRTTLTDGMPDELKLGRRKIDAIMANAAYRGMGLNVRTAPITYRSGNVYTIEATGIVHGAKMRELARHTIKEVVAVAPPALADWFQGGQVQFRGVMNRTFNNHIVTWPKFIPKYDLKFAYQNPAEEDAEDGELRLRHLELYPKAQHFRNTHMGHEIKQAQAFPLFGRNKRANQLQKNGQISTGSVSFFMKMTASQGLRQYILDFGEKEWENRISCYYDSETGEMVLEMADATIEDTKAQVRYKMKPELNQWYHLAIVWNSTLDGQLALFLDGMPVGDFVYYNGRDERIGSYLTSAVSEDATEIEVKSTDGFPDQGALRIGFEVIEYESKTANSFQVRTQWSDGFKMQTQSSRGARGTVALAHAEDCRVLPWGYTMPLKSGNDFFIGGAKLKGDFPKNESALVLVTKKSKNDKQPGPPRFVKDDLELEVESTDGFPDKGILAVWALGKSIEYIYYSGKQGKKFTGLLRGQEGSTAQDFNNGSIVYCVSMWVDQHSEYQDTGMVQLANEWVGYDKKNTTDGESFLLLMSGLQQLLTALLAGTDALHPLRGLAFTTAEDQKSGTKVIPTFEVPMTMTGLPTNLGLKPLPAGRYDRVTLINNNDNSQKEERLVWWQVLLTGDPDDPDDDKYYIAFDDFVARRYESKFQDQTRVLKFPSGELPNQLFGAYAGGKSPNAVEKGGTVSFWADELLIEPYGQAVPFFTTEAVDASVDKIPVVGITRTLNRGGVARIGNEFIAFTGMQVVDRRQRTGILTGVQRGFLGTQQTAHSTGAPVMNVAWCRVGRLGNEVADETHMFSITNGNRFPLEGHLLIGEELLGYTVRQGNTFYMPRNKAGEGAFRSSFGTDKSSHEAGEVAYFLPVRFPDRYALEADTPDISYYQSRWSAPSTRFFRITWDANLHQSQHLEVHALVRIDGKPDWDAKPVVNPDEPQEGQLMLFTVGDGTNSLGRRKGDRIEVRFMFKYKNGVLGTKFWKQTPRLKSFKVHYATGPSVLHRETSR